MNDGKKEALGKLFIHAHTRTESLAESLEELTSHFDNRELMAIHRTTRLMSELLHSMIHARLSNELDDLDERMHEILHESGVVEGDEDEEGVNPDE